VVSGHRRRWVRFFAGSAGAMCASTRRRGPGDADRSIPQRTVVAGRGFRRALWTLILTISRVYGYAKQGAEYGYTRVRGLHPLLATISTPIAAAVIAGTPMRRGSAGSAKGAASFVAEAITTARAAGVTVCCWLGWTRRVIATGPGSLPTPPSRHRI
jgi:hypothetical protein